VWDGSRFVPTSATFRITGTTPEYESTDFVVPHGPMAEAQNFWTVDNKLPTASHGHLAFYLLGDGENFVAGPDGIYKLTAELWHTPSDPEAAALPPVAPFSILFQVDRWADDDPDQPSPYPHSDADLDRAFAKANTPPPPMLAIVPEPSGVVLLALGATMLCRRRR
jgi:hypothetical protein